MNAELVVLGPILVVILILIIRMRMIEREQDAMGRGVMWLVAGSFASGECQDCKQRRDLLVCCSLEPGEVFRCGLCHWNHFETQHRFKKNSGGNNAGSNSPTIQV